MKPTQWFITNLCKLGLRLLCRIDAPDIHTVQTAGPLIAYSNHIGEVEVPMIYTHLYPRPLVGLAKAESWDNWFKAWLFDLWDGIPVRRGEGDVEAMRACIEALNAGKILGISPEGTRSKTHTLLRAHGGVALLALKSGAPLQPIAHWGGEDFTPNVKHLRRTDFHIRVGKRFYLDARGEKVTKETRQQMADEVMYQLAKLLPEQYRGEYSDLEHATEKYLRFE